MNTGKCFKTLRGHEDEVLDICFNSTGTRLATASADGTGRVYNVSTATCIAELLGHTGEISKVSFNPSGNMIITGSADHTARLFSENG